MTNEYFKVDKHLAEGSLEQTLGTRATYEHGSRAELPAFYRFVVIETVFDTSIIDSSKIAYFEHTLGVANIHFAAALPRNTIIAQRVLASNASAATPPMFLFPFFPPTISLPCQPGEHVWVMFENPTGTKNDLGYWMCRIVEPGFVEDVNHTHSPRSNDPSFTPGIKDLFEDTSDPKYEFRNGRGDERDGARYTVAETATLSGGEDAYEQLMATTDGGKLSVYEAVPRFRKRPGDVAFEGTNNTLVVLGRDRTGAVATYKVDDTSQAQVVDTTPITDDGKPGAGAIDIVVGRGQTDQTLGKEVPSLTTLGAPTGNNELGKSSADLSPQEGDPDFLQDRSRIYIAQRTKPDTNFGINTFNAEMGAGPVQGASTRGDATDNTLSDGDTGDAAVVIKSDKLRLIARSDVEIIVTGILSRDAKGRLVADDSNYDGYAAMVIKANGDIVFRPSKKGYIKLGGDDADKAVVCSDVPAVAADGVVTGAPLTTTMGGQFAGAKAGAPNDNGPALAASQAKFSAKVLIK